MDSSLITPSATITPTRIARRESSQTTDWQEANRKLRERLQARDDNLLEVVRKGETLAFGEWADRFLENYSKPPIRAEKTHEANQRCMKHLKAAFAKSRLVDVTADSIELFFVTVFDSASGSRPSSVTRN